MNQTVVPTQTLTLEITTPTSPVLPGYPVTVQVWLSDSDYLDNADVAISYDTSRLEVPSTISFTGNTHGNTTVDGITSTAGLFIGEVISGPGIPLNDTIATVGTGNITLTTDATSTVTGRSFTASSVHPDSVTSTFYYVVNLDATAGTINVSMSRPSGPLSGQGSGSVLMIQFYVKSAAPVGPASINLLQGNGGFMTALHASDGKDDLGNFVLQPTVSPGVLDDGIVTVEGVTTTTVSSSSTVNQSVFGQAVTFTATVQSYNGVPTGTVTFSDGSASIGTGSVSGTTATFSTTSLNAATHTIMAVYGGDNNFTGSTPATVLQTVFQTHSTTSLAFSLNPSTTGQTVTFTATVVANNPGSGIATGTITFEDGSMSIGTGLLVASTATFSDSSLTQGNHQISAVFVGDSNFVGSISPTLTQTVNIVSLRVSTFTQTATGFTAIFNRALNVGTVSSPVLNLYDNSSGTLGPADVTLVGTATGSITGSLVVDPTATQITFIETGQSGVLGLAAPCTLFGVLPNDTYTVTLRSATNGFKDTNGNLLDGNADGTQGGDYVTTFVVNNPSNSVTVTLPDFARGAGQLVNVPNTDAADNTFSNGLPLRLYNGINFTGSTTSGNQTVAVLTTAGLRVGDTVTGLCIFGGNATTTGIDTITGVGPGNQITLSHPATATSSSLANHGVVLNDSSGTQTITSVSLTLAYDPSLLSVDASHYSIDGLNDPSGSEVTTFDTSTTGLIKITFTTSTGIVLLPGGSQPFISLHTVVPSTANYASKEILDLQNIDINNGTFTSGNCTAIDDAAVHVSSFLGDSTGDRIYTGLDAQRIARKAVGIDPGFKAWVLADPRIVGDVDGDQQLTGLDALTVARQAVGITQSVIPQLPSVTPAILGPDPVLSIPTTFNAAPGSAVQVPVNLDHSAGLDSVNVAIAYDPSRLDVSAADVQRGSLTQTFDSFAVNVNEVAGIIRISGYRSAGPLAGSGGGSLAVINFQVRANAPAGPTIINLLQNAGTTWTLLGGTDAQGNDFLFDLQPQVSNVAGDPLDGRIVVVPPPPAAGNISPVAVRSEQSAPQQPDSFLDTTAHRVDAEIVAGLLPPTLFTQATVSALASSSTWPESVSRGSQDCFFRALGGSDGNSMNGDLAPPNRQAISR